MPAITSRTTEPFSALVEDSQSSASVAIKAVILSAGPVPNEIAALFRCSSIGMIPINGRPLITLQLEMLRSLGVESFKIAIRRQDARLREYVAQYARISGIDVDTIEIQSDRGPGGTLLEALAPDDLAGGVVVLLGDTLVENTCVPLIPGENHVFTAPVQDPERWCMVYQDDCGTVTELDHKPASAAAAAEAAVGYYWLGNVSAETWSVARGNTARRIELTAIFEPIMRAHGLKRTTIRGWLDCGNVDLLLATRRKMVAARSFNTLTIDELRSTVRKRSRNSEKFRHEIDYYRLLPADLAVFFPRLISYETSQADAHVELEYYAYPTLNEVYIYQEQGPTFWSAVVTKLGAILDKFAQRSVVIDPDDCARFYHGKLEERLEAAVEQSVSLAALLTAGELVLNGQSVRGVPTILGDLRRELQRIASGVQGTIIHGDLCFANILIEPLHQTIRFIDPRGSFHEVGVFGDSRYDHAKLWHSVDGNYDAIISDMFNLQVTGNRINFDCYRPKVRGHLLRCLEDAVPSSTTVHDLRVIESTLFLSMLPLHADEPRRQLAMLATGLTILNEEL